MIHWLDITERSAIAAARRLARQSASKLALDPARMEEVAIVATEGATNILRYAGSGRMFVQPMKLPEGGRLAMVFADRGPGIADPERMMEDGVSGGGSAGLGLGAMRRLSDRFDLFTANDGTVIACEIDGPGVHAAPGLDIAALLLTHPGETVPGDAYRVAHRDGRTDILVVDGLGHGPRAAEAAADCLDATRGLAPDRALARAAEMLTGTRGSVAAALSLDPSAMTLSYAAIGNIATLRIRDGKQRRFAVRDGRIGGPKASAYTEEDDLRPGDLFIAHSDGLSTLRDLDRQGALLARSPLAIAGRLADRHFRGRDDATIVVVRVTGP